MLASRRHEPWCWGGSSGRANSSATATIDKGINSPSNLYLGDRRSNAADALRNGRHATGERHPRAKLSDAQVLGVRRALARGERGRDLARAYGVHKSTICRIGTGTRRGRPAARD